MKKIWIITAVVVLVGAMGLRLAANKKKIDEKKTVTIEKNVSVPVNVMAVKSANINENLIKTGTLIPFEEANIAATTSGNLSSVHFALGSNVGRGAILAQIDNKMLSLRLEAAELQQIKLQKDYGRYTTLLKGDATSETSVQDVKFNLDNSENQISQIKKQLADNQIKAPISGQVVEKKVSAGEFVNPGTVLGKIVDVSRLKVDVKVTEADAYKIKNGQDVTITTELYPGQQFKGQVVFVSQQGDAAHNYSVQVELPNSSAHPLKAGTFVYADFVQNSQHTALLIPRTALAESMKNPYVYVIEDNKAVTRKITVGKEAGADIEVIDGLKEGEQVIVNGQINITNGTAVQVVK
jgi:multidrug efflux system membrane fusion protein